MLKPTDEHLDMLERIYRVEDEAGDAAELSDLKLENDRNYQRAYRLIRELSSLRLIHELFRPADNEPHGNQHQYYLLSARGRQVLADELERRLAT